MFNGINLTQDNKKKYEYSFYSLSVDALTYLHPPLNLSISGPINNPKEKDTWQEICLESAEVKLPISRSIPI